MTLSNDSVIVARDQADAAWDVVKTSEKEWSLAASAWNIAARKRSPDAWQKAVARIKNKKVQCRVAGIVWWDYFGDRSPREAWPHLNEYIEAYKRAPDVDEEKIRKALREVGFPARIAELRCKAEENKQEEKEHGDKKDNDTVV